MYININITFMHISRFILASKLISFTFFHMNIHSHHHIFQRRFVYNHTFFCSKIMCGRRLAICLYNIRRASCERRLHHSLVALSVPISATFVFTLGKICSWSIRAATPVLSRADAPIIYRYYISGENFISLNTRTHMRKIKSIRNAKMQQRKNFLAYNGKLPGKNCKRCNAHARPENEIDLLL